MAALSSGVSRTMAAQSSPRNFIVKNGSTVFEGSLVGLELATGHILPIANSADKLYLGVAQRETVGDGTLTCPVIIQDVILDKTDVTGYASATNNRATVYATTDNDLTLVRPADDANPVGVTTRFDTANVGDVHLFSSESANVLHLAGGCKKRVNLVPLVNTVIANGDLVTGYTLWGSGKIVGLGVIVTDPVTTAAKLSDLEVEIGGVQATGTLGLTSANLTPLGVVVEQAITGVNTFSDGDLLDIEAANTTAFIEGSIQLFVDIEYTA